MQKRNKRRRRISRISLRLRLTNPVLHFEVRSTTQTHPLFAPNSSPVRKYLLRQGRYRLLLLSQPSHHKVSHRRGADVRDHLDLKMLVHLYQYSARWRSDCRARARAVGGTCLAGWLPGSRTLNIWNIWPPRSLARSETFAIFFPCFISDGRGGGGRRDGAMTK